MDNRTKLSLDDMSEEFGYIIEVLSAMGVSTEKLKRAAEDYNDSIQDSIMQQIIETLNNIGMTVEDIKKALSAYTEEKKRGTDSMSEVYRHRGANISNIRKGIK